LEEARHSLIIIEYDPLQYEDAQEMNEYISKALKQASEAYDATLFVWHRSILGGLDQAG
jgi:hypothetical protein